MSRPQQSSHSFPEARHLLELVQALVAEIHPQRGAPSSITLDSALDRDLGLDSLARVELIARIEKHFGVALPEQVFAEAATPRDLLRAVQGVGTAAQSLPAAKDAAALEVVEGGLEPEAEAEAVTSLDSGPDPEKADTLLDVLFAHAQRHPQRNHVHFYQDQGAGEELSYGELLAGAQRLAGGLVERGLRPGEPVALMLGSDRDYFLAFYGVLLGGGIPVPLYPPARPSQIEDHMRRHRAILENCGARILITVPAGRGLARFMKMQVDRLAQVVTVAELEGAKPFGGLRRSGSDIAFLQYTSGSTGDPKGVVLTHDNLLANIRAMGRWLEAGAGDVFVSWLPLYHDMGLIGAWLGSLYYGARFVVMSPLAFISRPQRWLWALHRHGGTLSAGPNFGYELCLRRIDESELEGLDLSRWRAAFNGAEAVSPETIERFCTRFARYGFRRQAMMPVYGLAESTVGLAFPPLGRGPLVDRIQRQPFMRGGRAVPAEEDDATALRFVACGRPLPGHEIRIVDEFDQELPERQEGRLQFRGPSATSGYYRNPEATRRLFRDGWLDSGDLAYMAAGEVYLTGRVKDIIIRAGRNLYPHELEEQVGQIEGVRSGRVAAFGSRDPVTGTERLVLVAETREQDGARLEALRRRINEMVTERAGAPPDEVLLVPPDSILKTSSGKIRRDACRQLYEQGKLGRRRPPVWRQVLRLSLSALQPQLRRLRRLGGALVFGLYARAVFWAITPWTWLLVVTLPRRSWRWKVMRASGRMLARFTATPLAVEGLEHLPPPDRPCIYVANHASYLDGPVLIALLPRDFTFVAKAELSREFLAGLFLRRIGTTFVERFDVQRSVEDARTLRQAVQAGHSLMFFPEGTFTRQPGLLPFRMGAFLAAAEADVPVVPVTIRGTRSILRADTWLPARGRIRVVVGEPVERRALGLAADAPAWRVALALRDAARARILAACGEPDLAEERVFPPGPTPGSGGGANRKTNRETTAPRDRQASM